MQAPNIVKGIWSDCAGRFIVLGIVTALARLLLAASPEFTEGVYSRGIFLGVRYLLDYTVGWWPWPFSYVLIVALLGYWGWKAWRNRKQARPPRPWLRALRNVGGFAGALVFFFHVLWGFNYERVPIEERLGLRMDSLDVGVLCEEAEWAARQAEADRAAIAGATDDSLSWSLMPQGLEEEVRRCVHLAMDRLGYPHGGRVRGRIIEPGGWMLRIGIAGIYNPFTGEGNVSGAQTPQKIPFTMAHEMAHGCGFGDEGSCNFIGMVACGLSDDPFVRYSGQIAYFTHLRNEIFVADPLLAQMLTDQLDPGIKADARANYNNYWRYHGLVADIGREVNNAYLHTQGVQGGIKSYDRVVLMRAACHRQLGL